MVLRCGVMVAPGILVPLVSVRIATSQLKRENLENPQILIFERAPRFKEIRSEEIIFSSK